MPLFSWPQLTAVQHWLGQQIAPLAAELRYPLSVRRARTTNGRLVALVPFKLRQLGPHFCTFLKPVPDTPVGDVGDHLDAVRLQLDLQAGLHAHSPTRTALAPSALASYGRVSEAIQRLVDYIVDGDYLHGHQHERLQILTDAMDNAVSLSAPVKLRLPTT